MSTDRSDDATCEACGTSINLTAAPPCPHGIPVCPDCEAAQVCEACREDVEREALMETPC